MPRDSDLVRPSPAARPVALAALAVLLSVSASIAVAAGGASSPGHAIPDHAARVRGSLAVAAPRLFHATAAEDELAGLVVVPLDPGMTPDRVLRSRPFVIGENAAAAFPTRAARADAIDEAEGAARLRAFLRARGAERERIDEALRRYDDPTVHGIVPDPSLRAALLMLSGWNPYRATIAAVLDGENPSGDPYAVVDFADLGVDGAIAALTEDAAGRHVLSIDRAYRREPPEALIPTLVHESLHGGGENSAEEELVATILDTICWAEVLAIDPDLAYGASDLAVYNNAKLVGLLNSTGQNGPGQVGITTSHAGDVYVGRGYEEVDAESIRAVVESDGFYGALRHTGSDGQETTAALLRRFPGGESLGATPRYEEAMVTIIDAGLPEILPPEAVVALAATLGLDLAVGTGDGTGYAGALLDLLPGAAGIGRPVDRRKIAGMLPIHRRDDLCRLC